MKIEYELKILDIDIQSVQQKLKNVWAIYIEEKQMKRYVYDFLPPKQKSRIRLRSEGKNTTLTIKEIHDSSIEWTKELEINVSDFERTHQLLQKLWYNEKLYQENNRISYILDWVQIEIDHWPHINPYLEIEWSSREEVEKTVQKLWYTIEETTTKTTKDIYTAHWFDLHTMTILQFDT